MNTMRKCSTCSTLYSGDLCPKCVAGFAQKATEPTAASDELPLKPGQSFHGYEILELLGRGGMGVVFKARQPALDRLIALKILPQKMALDPDFQNRFIREAKALGSLNHPNLVAVYDFGAEAGLFFFAMEFVDGTNLRQVLRDRKLSAEQALKIVPQLCDALEFAHAEGIVHRDIKPENILLDKKGRVKIADFGLAKLVGADTPSNLTMTNMVMGTPHYMAPEQVENPKGVDHRADIYAIGVVFYEMLTGELPIGRFEMPSKMVQIDVRLDEVVLKALEKAPDRRYQKASDVKDAVTRATAVTSVESYSPTVMTPKPAVPPKKLPAAVWIAAALAGVAACAFAVLPSRPTTPTTLPAVTTPASEGPFDLSKLYFGPDERPANWVYQQTGTEFPRNPMVAKDAPELDIIIKNLDGIGLQNVDRSDLKQAYVAAWWRWETAFIAMETSIGERLEREFLSLQRLQNKWTHRKGPLLVLAWTSRAESRDAFVELVGMIQKKLGLPATMPDVPLAHLKLEKGDAPEGATLRAAAPLMAGMPGATASSEQEVVGPGGKGGILIHAALFASDEQAAAAEKALAAPLAKDAVRSEIYRGGRTVLGIANRSRAVAVYEKLASDYRRLFGHKGQSFETIIPTEGELPSGYAFATIEADPKGGLPSGDFEKAWRATLKPAGRILLLQLKEGANASEVREELRKKGPAWDANGIVWGVEAPDDAALDVIENFMREKCGWSRNAPRPIQLLHARLGAADLPPGFELADETIDRNSFTCTIKNAELTLTCRVRWTHDYGTLNKVRGELPYKAGDVLLVKDTVVAYVGGPEAAWPALDQIEATLRRKMRMGPAEIADYQVRAAELPKGSVYLDRPNLMSPNPKLQETEGKWEAIVDPSETRLTVYRLEDEAKAEALEKSLKTERQALKAPARFQSFRRGVVVATVEQQKPGDAVFSALADVMRAKLRLQR